MKTLKENLEAIGDPRIDRSKLHSLEDIIQLTLIAVICGCESWETIEEFGRSKESFLRQYLLLPNGIPSHDTIERLFKRMDSDAFNQSFLAWVKSLQEKGCGNVVSIDGKTVRGSRDEGNGKYAIHMVSAWSKKNRLVLGQVKTTHKSNELEAIKELLNLLDIEQTVITLDAAGCQREIVEQITAKKADYLIGVKDNQPQQKQAIAYEFKVQKITDTNQQIEKNHGRIETRTCQVINKLEELEGRQKWRELKSIIKITATREVNNKLSQEVRYYISSLLKPAEYFNQAVRDHWAIENQLHWVLDMQFNEDKVRKRKDHAAENMAIIRRMALNKVTKAPLKRYGIENRRRIAAFNDTYLAQILKN